MASKKVYNFGEAVKEWNPKFNKEVAVWQSPKYQEARKKAIETIENEAFKGVITEADFWILKGTTKNGNIAYNGLIISHNGCLKINDVLPIDKRFKPSCVSLDTAGYNNSLVYSYCCEDQGIFEVGEVSKANSTNAYPYAMALKRLMDRVILKNSRLAYSSIYSDAEAEELKNEPQEPKEEVTESTEEAEDVTIIKTNPRQDLVDWCNKKGYKIRDAATEYKLNNNSKDEEFVKALSGLKKLYGE